MRHQYAVWRAEIVAAAFVFQSEVLLMPRQFRQCGGKSRRTLLEKFHHRGSQHVDAEEAEIVAGANSRHHQALFGLCGNACLIQTIDLLAHKVYGIRFYANASPQSLDRARHDHLEMIKALRAGRREELIALTSRHLKPSPEAYIKAYEQRFGKTE